ncbi:MAG: 23S rRNA (uracil(1939)-C(5))-methyltransferase RlmD, partial [Oscillospiraceae bacterium]
QQVADAVERIGGFPEVEIRPILGAATRNRYRNKAQLPLGLNSKGELQMGCYSAHSHRIVNMGSCLLQPMVFTMAMEAFREWHGECGGSVYHEKEHTGLLRHLYLRWGEKTGEV